MKKNSDNISGSFSGKYIVIIRGFRGELVLKKTATGYSGTIFFKNWGKGVPIPVRKLRINNNKIYFYRSVKNREELLKYGGSRYFDQKYSGFFSKDGSRIRGTFIDSGTQANWEAKKS